ncbi:MAG: HAD-IIA family hydrolase [Candidatus Hadarchaeales archaeon]
MLEHISSLIVDLDGVLWWGKKPIQGAAEALQELQRRGKKLAFLTNNSTLSRMDCKRRLWKLGLQVELERIVTSSYGAALYLKAEHAARVYVIGERGLKEELKLAGIKMVDGEAGGITHVVVGLDRKLTYNKLVAGMRAILSGAKFVATNRDCSFPSERGLLPGAGAIVSSLEAASGRSPDVVIGKPEPFLIRLALKALGSQPRTTALVGDRIETDFQAAKRAGLKMILVLTGVTKELGRGPKPDLVVKSLGDLL